MKLLLKTTIKREKGKLYFCKNSDDGFICIYEADMARGRIKKGIDLNKELIKRKIVDDRKGSIRKRIEDQIYEDMFGTEKKEGK